MSPCLYLILLLFTLAVLLITLYRLIYTQFIQPGPIYYPTPLSTVQKMLRLAKLTPKDTLIDLGSGDGRLLIQAALSGSQAIGYEIDPILAHCSRRQAAKLNLSHLVTVHTKSFWQANLNQATVITAYLFPRFMNRLQKQIEAQITHPLRLVCHQYPLPRKKYTRKLGNLYLYHFRPLGQT